MILNLPAQAGINSETLNYIVISFFESVAGRYIKSQSDFMKGGYYGNFDSNRTVM